MLNFLQPDPFHGLRSAMVEQQLRARGIRDERVLAAMKKVPRHRFVPDSHLSSAYGDHPIPIAEGQTISQPYIVAAMLEALELGPADSALEVGTGSGYQAALLAELVKEVYSIERHERLAGQAREILQQFGYGNIHIRVGDGAEGWPEAAPFDAIVVAAAVPQVPAALIEQMSEGGAMILPVGTPVTQDLQLVRKLQGRATLTRLDACRFVPLIGRGGFSPGS